MGVLVLLCLTVCLWTLNRFRSVFVVWPVYCLLHFLHVMMYMTFFELHVKCCLMMKDAFVILLMMYGELFVLRCVRQRESPQGWVPGGLVAKVVWGFVLNRRFPKLGVMR